ncbi:MAG: hypothetical protein GFH27_549297n228 [Chloroflexi bacterium AL-W]|nr:hypothetical protein [Chloroflexi bacterium AL-N1]NOK68918.1 hypothetical protein [Chloroflexi bacterium AL-N10]NOK76901.1 hypothetical protein [Chloroflexi bacterium AL-N5]NOK82711.1 hypothetical protein [Chloroflexi bacterium AL-W]NOK90758.1 hypothetical protein [Chloroflexi bacterium AL-N15]
MSRLRWAVLGGIMLGGVGASYWFNQRAQIRSATITSITFDNLPVASVAITYTRGMPPVSVIIDIIENDKSKGSTTIGGKQLFVDIPLHAPVHLPYCLVTTAYWRSLRGVVRQIQHHHQ